MRLSEVSVEVAHRGASSGQTNPRFSLVLCAGCGRTEWFTDPRDAVAHWQALGGDVEPIAVAQAPAPYR